MTKLEEIREYLKNITPEESNSDDEEIPQCSKCGEEFYVKDGYEMTQFCDPCAQDIAANLSTYAEYLLTRCERLEKALRDGLPYIKRASGNPPWDEVHEALEEWIPEAESLLREG